MAAKLYRADTSRSGEAPLISSAVPLALATDNAGALFWTLLSGLVGGDGAPGVAGVAGPAGANGAIGATGATGPSGTAGTAGATGSAGGAGSAGATGATGPAGAAGATGTQGSAGTAFGVIRWDSFAAAGNTSTNYMQVIAGTPDTNEYKSRQIIGTAGTFTKITVSCAFALSASNTFTVTLRVNGVDTSLTLTIGASQVSGNATGSVAVNVGDIVSMKVVQSGTGTASSWACAVEIY